MRGLSRGGRADPVSSRLYRLGDDLRLVDRHATARLAAARGGDDLVVREHLTEEAAHVAVVVDRSPSMSLYPASLPWLHKPAAVGEAVRLIAESARRARSRIDRHETEFLEETLVELGTARSCGRGSFVFVLSDFLDPASEHAWAEALERGFDVVPVVIQDPLWEQSFPDVGGAVLPLVDGVGGRVRRVRLTHEEALARKTANEGRFDAMLRAFESLRLDPIVLGSARPAEVLECFRCWSDCRRAEAGCR